jgi:Ca2+-binding RTX toxin-like protein
VTVTNGSGGTAPTATINGDGSWTLSGMDKGDTFTVTATTDPFSAIEITGTGSKTFTLGPATFDTAYAVDPFDVMTPIIATDGDGDPQASSVSVTLTPDAHTTQGSSGDDLGLQTTCVITTLLGEDGNDTLTGLDGQVDILAGGRGNDTLVGLGGADQLYGGSGADHFKFTAPTEGLDHILDFNMAESDTIDILASAFGGGLTAGTDASAPGMFGSDATDNFASGAERFHFNTATHTLLYSADGSSGSAVQLAVLENGGTIDQSHIHIV